MQSIQADDEQKRQKAIDDLISVWQQRLQLMTLVVCIRIAPLYHSHPNVYTSVNLLFIRQLWSTRPCSKDGNDTTATSCSDSQRNLLGWAYHSCLFWCVRVPNFMACATKLDLLTS